jgi:hypothetical protein
MQPMNSAAPSSKSRLTARAFNSGFARAYEAFNGISCASNGKIYYALVSKALDLSVQMYCYDPATEKITHIAALTETVGEQGLKAIPQGKVHVSFAESGGKLYFSTHMGYFEIRDGMETYAHEPPLGYKQYPGGHFLSYDIASGKFEDFGIANPGEGIITMSMDTKRGRLYGLTWPSGSFVRYDVNSREMKNLGKAQGGGEFWPAVGSTYRAICRSLAVDPEDGSVYFTRSDGPIFCCRYGSDRFEVVDGVDMKKDYFGQYDPSSPGAGGYNWRQMVWYSPEKVFYGVHGNSGYLFRFDPRIPALDVLERITSKPSQRCGMFDLSAYGYLTLTLGLDGHTLYYLTGSPIFVDGKRLAGDSTIKYGSKGKENFHLITYDIRTAKYADHGAVFLGDGQCPREMNSIAVGKDGAVYTLARFTENGVLRTDLVRITMN